MKDAGSVMKQISALLRTRMGEIASSVAALCDVPNLDETLRPLIEGMAERTLDPMSLDVAPLRDAGLDEATIARVLHALFFETVEKLRPALDEASLSKCALAMRACIQEQITRPAVRPEDAEFFRRLIEGDCQGLAPEHARLLSLFGALTSTSRDIVYVHDVNGMLLYVNRPGLDWTKFTVEDVRQGLSVFDLIVPDYVDLVEARIESPGTVSRSPYSIEILSKDGTRIPVELTTRIVTGGGQYDSQTMAIIGLARDLRLDRRFEDEIRRTNMCLDATIRHAPLGIIRADRDCTVLDANRAALSLIGAQGPNTLIGLSFLDISEGPATLLHGLLREALDTGEVVRRRFTETTSYGAMLDCDLTIVPLSGLPECAAGLLIFMADAKGQVP